MSQQMVNGSYYDGSVTVTYRMSGRYAVVNPPFSGLHLKPQDEEYLAARKMRWKRRNAPPEEEQKRHRQKNEVNHSETVYFLRKAVKTAAAGDQFDSPQHVEHQPGYPQTEKSKSIRQGQNTAVGSKRFILTVYFYTLFSAKIKKNASGS